MRFYVLVTTALIGFASAAATQPVTVDEVASLMEQLSAQVAAAEAAPLPEGSEGAARQLVVGLQQKLDHQQTVSAQRQSEIAAATAQIVAILPAFPASRLPPPGPTLPLPIPKNRPALADLN